MAPGNMVQAALVGALSVLSYLTVGATAVAVPRDESFGLAPRGAVSTPWTDWYNPNVTWFNLQTFVVDQKYHRSKPSFIGFAGADAFITQNRTEASQFWTWEGQLGVGDKFVTLDFSNGYAVVQLDERPTFGPWKFLYGKDQWLHVQGSGFTYGEGSQAVFCQSDDGFVFLQGQGKPPFACRDIGFVPRQRSGPKPRLPAPCKGSPGHPVTSYEIKTITITVAPPSAPTWFIQHPHPAPATVTITPPKKPWSGSHPPSQPNGNTDNNGNSNQWGDWSDPSSDNSNNGGSNGQQWGDWSNGGHGGKPAKPTGPRPVGPTSAPWGDWEPATTTPALPTPTTTDPSWADWNVTPTTTPAAVITTTTTPSHPLWTTTTPSHPDWTATTTAPWTPDPSSDNDWSDWQPAKRSFEFDAEGEQLD